MKKSKTAPFRPAIIEISANNAADDVVTIPLNPRDVLIVRDRPLTIEEERHNQRIINETVQRTRGRKPAPAADTVSTPEVGVGISPVPVAKIHTVPLKEILGE